MSNDRRLLAVCLLAVMAGEGCKSGNSSSSAAPSTGGDGGVVNKWTARDLGPGRLVAVNGGYLLGLDTTDQAFVIPPSAVQAGTRTAIPPFRAEAMTVGTAIESDGSAVGYSEGPEGRVAVRTTSGGWTAAGAPGDAWSAALGLDGARIVGVAVNRANPADQRAFSVSGGTPATLPLPSDRSSAAYVAREGRTAGVVETASGATHAFLISDGAMKDLGTLGGANSAAYAMNASGDVVGAAEVADGSEHAFYVPWGGSMVDLGLPAGAVASDARGIDAQRRVAGNVYDASRLSRPVVFVPGGTAIDLMPKDAAGVPFMDAHVAAMAADGTIVGWGTPAGATKADGLVHCILWTPGG